MRYLNKLILLCFSIFFLCGCSITKKEPLSKTGFHFDTIIKITLYDSRDEKILNTCFDYCKELKVVIFR